MATTVKYMGEEAGQELAKKVLARVDEKQDTLTAGENVTISEDGTISVDLSSVEVDVSTVTADDVDQWDVWSE
ncbi:MAG: hypothetical protein LUI09_05730 [Prevotellaceae bacterium]|nr:hypothetical protein [Prevotellaceae bacterium]